MHPETFQRELEARLGRDYRVRWSSARDVWAIECRTKRGLWDPPRNGWDDVAIRARDGYALIMEVAPSPTIKCLYCKSRYPIATMACAESRCEYCTKQGIKTAYTYIGHFPLCDALIARLERSLPHRAKEFWASLKAEEDRLNRTNARDLHTYNENVAADWRRLHLGVPFSGFGSGPASHGNSDSTFRRLAS